MTKFKDDIVKNSTKFAIGGIPGHRAVEHLVSIKCIIDRQLRKGSGIIVQFYDIETFFDSENL